MLWTPLATVKASVRSIYGKSIPERSLFWRCPETARFPVSCSSGCSLSNFSSDTMFNTSACKFTARPHHLSSEFWVHWDKYSPDSHYSNALFLQRLCSRAALWCVIALVGARASRRFHRSHRHRFPAQRHKRLCGSVSVPWSRQQRAGCLKALRALDAKGCIALPAPRHRGGGGQPRGLGQAAAPSTPEKWTFQLWLDTRIDITAPLGDDGSDTTAHSCSVVTSAVTSTVHHSVATSPDGQAEKNKPLE